MAALAEADVHHDPVVVVELDRPPAESAPFADLRISNRVSPSEEGNLVEVVEVHVEAHIEQRFGVEGHRQVGLGDLLEVGVVEQSPEFFGEANVAVGAGGVVEGADVAGVSIGVHRRIGVLQGFEAGSVLEVKECVGEVSELGKCLCFASFEAGLGDAHVDDVSASKWEEPLWGGFDRHTSGLARPSCSLGSGR